jgi:stage V sporulation protein S
MASSTAHNSGPPRTNATRRPVDTEAPPGSDFWDRIQRGNNTTRVGATTSPRTIASQIAAQARAAVDAPLLRCVGPQAINQAVKAIAIARTYLEQSDASGSCLHPDVSFYPEFIKVDSGAEEELSAMQLKLAKRSRRTGVDSQEYRSLKVSNQTDAKSLAGAIASCTREGSRVELTAIGAGSVNQSIKAIAIARQYVDEEAIDLSCRPEFIEVNMEAPPQEALTNTGVCSALRLMVLVEQT